MTLDETIKLGVSLLGWSLGGMLALFLSRKVYDVITPFDADKELTEDKNVAVGISKGGFLVGSAIILHGLIQGQKLHDDLFMEAGVTAGFLLLCFVLLWLGRFVLVKTTAFDFNHHIHEADNVAVGWVEGAFYVALAIVIHGAL